MTRSPRSRVRAYLALARVSNLPTVWTNVLAGMVLTGQPVSPGLFTALAVSVSLLYCAGMAFNDVMDYEHDVRHRADRPLPSAELTHGEASFFAVTLMLWGAGGVVGSTLPGSITAVATIVAFTLALCGGILYYNLRHKENAAGPLVMGLCRGLVYCCAGAGVAGTVPQAVLMGAAIGTAYVTGLTLVAKYGGHTYGWTIAWLIAGICIVDAGLILAAGAPQLAALALLGFPLTLLGQRLVRGT